MEKKRKTGALERPNKKTAVFDADFKCLLFKII